MLKATHKHNISLNSEKLQFEQKQVDFSKQVLTENGIQSAKEKLKAIRNIKTPSNIEEFQAGHGDLPELLFDKANWADIITRAIQQACPH